MPPTDIDMHAYAQRVVMIESGGNPHARNPRSSAAGLHQFTKGTWDALRHAHPQLGLTPNGRLNADESRRAFRLFTANNARYLAEALGRPADAAELYLAHWLGSLGAVRTIRCAQAEATGRPAAVGFKSGAKSRGGRCSKVVAYVRTRFRGDVPTYTVDEEKFRPRSKATARDLNDQEMQRLRAMADAALSND